MDELSLAEYVNARCGEVYLSVQGNLIFLCSLCNDTFKGYGLYLEHILGTHDLPVYCVEELETNVILKEEELETNVILKEEEIAEDELVESIEMFDDDCQPQDLVEKIEELDSDTCEEIDLDTKYSLESPENHDENSQVFLTDIDESFELREEELSNTDENMPSLGNGKKCRKRNRNDYPSQGMFKCPICQLEIKGKSNLEKHILRHNDDNKRFQCTYCPKRFHVKFELRQHESSHTGERPCLCTICGRRFVSTGKLNEHINMTHENIRNKTCEVCNKKFYSNKYLRRHMQIHTTERCHKCEICGAAFKIRKTLIAHMKLHENKREYQCKICDAQFNQRPALHSHMKTRHKSILIPEDKAQDTNIFFEKI